MSTINNFCETAGKRCDFSYCDENGCNDRKRNTLPETGIANAANITAQQAADTARNAPGGRNFFAGGEDAKPQAAPRKFTPYQWGLTLHSSQEHDELVRLIRAHGWRCSDALSELGGYDASVPHVFWENNHMKLWRGRFNGLPQISFTKLPAKMTELAEALGHSV